MKKQFPSRINDFFLSAIKRAQEMLLKDGYHSPMCFVFSNGKIIPYICNYKSDDEKIEWFEGFREELGKLNAEAVVFVSEAWIKDVNEGKLDLVQV